MPISLHISTPSLHYARISSDEETYNPKLYKGICQTSLKNRYANLKKSFNAEKNKNDTKLSTEYWKLTSPTDNL